MNAGSFNWGLFEGASSPKIKWQYPWVQPAYVDIAEAGITEEMAHRAPGTGRTTAELGVFLKWRHLVHSQVPRKAVIGVIK